MLHRRSNLEIVIKTDFAILNTFSKVFGKTFVAVCTIPVLKASIHQSKLRFFLIRQFIILCGI